MSCLCRCDEKHVDNPNSGKKNPPVSSSDKTSGDSNAASVPLHSRLSADSKPSQPRANMEGPVNSQSASESAAVKAKGSESEPVQGNKPSDNERHSVSSAKPRKSHSDGHYNITHELPDVVSRIGKKITYEQNCKAFSWELQEALVESKQAEDSRTPDDWIPRSGALIRCTGLHPFNAEPPAALLNEAGLVTPAPLHYVRNHGSVPKLEANAHTLTIGGVGVEQKQLSVEDLKKLPSIEIPVTIVCDGNRRKELNMIQHGKGFNWGPAAVATARWKGALLCELLKSCGIKDGDKGNLYVCFEGKEDLPKGKYGTSFPLSYAMDPLNDIMIAYEMNGHELPPDHGHPLRLVIPGFVGGRMVKWLAKITVSEKESSSWYHWHDNKVLPSFVDCESVASGWWDKPEYTLYELNVNSVITSPSNEELVSVGNLKDTYCFKGYAYGGGGRPITRVELTFDDGATWELAQFKHVEGAMRHGFKCWTWVHWSLEVPRWRLLTLHNRQVAVRAWDRGLQGQPEKPTWNLLGMMNNSYYKLQVSVGAPNEIRFLHPVQPGRMTGGWMKGRAPGLPPTLEIDTTQGFRPIPVQEVAKHNTVDDCWVIIDGRVYDFTPYLKEHPGGAHAITAYAGGNASASFHDIHPRVVDRMKEMFCIGCVVEPLPPQEIDRENKHLALDPRRWMDATLVERKELSNDSVVFRFVFKQAKEEACQKVKRGELPSPRSGSQDNEQKTGNQDETTKGEHADKASTALRKESKEGTSKPPLRRAISLDVKRAGKAEEHKWDHHSSDVLRVGLPTGQHVLVGAQIKDEFVARPYTPIRPVIWEEDDGTLDLLVKIYRPSGNHPGGKMSCHFDQLKVGDTLKMRGPNGAVLYHGNGHFTVRGYTFQASRVSFITGGSGVTPIYQVLAAALKDPEEPTKFAVIDCNHTYEDILLRDEFERLNQDDRFHLWHTISEAPPANVEWKYSVGRINEEMMRQHLFPPGLDSVVFVCGPPSMIEKGCYPLLEKMGFSIDEDVFEF